MKFSMGNLDFNTNENHVTMNRRKYPNTPYKKFEIHQVTSTGKIRDSPTSSILKTPTAIFVTTRSSSAKTKRLKFANGPVDLLSLRNGSRDSSISLESSVEDRNEDRKLTNNGDIVFEDSIVEVAISPVKTMQVSPDSWKAFLAYQKYKDYANETEKTDYTYSRMSKYRHKEIIPGFLVMPNLSRSSLSSRRSSLSLPSSQSSYNESYTSGSYDFNISSPKSLDLSYELKMPNNQSNKFTRSKYYLRSSTYDGGDIEVDPKQNNYENEYYSSLEPVKIVKKTTYMTTGSPEKISKSYTYSSSEMPEKLKLSKSYNYSESEVPDYQTRSFSYSTSGMPEKLSKSYNYSMSEMPEKESSAFTYSASDVPEKGSGTFTYSTSGMPEKGSGKFSYSTSGMPDNLAKLSYSASEMPEPGSHYYGKVRSMNLDDADIDEVDDNSALYDKNYYNSPSSSGYVWSQKKPMGIAQNFTNFFTTMFLYVTSVGTFTKDLFSKYVLRRQDGWSGTSGSGFGWKSDKLGYATASGSWIPWSKDRGYSTSSYYSGRYYGQPRTWYQRFYDYINEKFSTMTNFIWGNSASHIQSRYYQTSSRRRFWWFLIPLLLLAGLWLYKAEQDNGFISNQYKALDCKTNGLLTSVEDTIKPMWRSGYVAYKKAAASASCYVNDSWERLKLPFSHIYELLCSKLSLIPGTSLGFVWTIWDTLWQGIQNFFALSRDAFSNMCLFLFGFFTDFLSAVSSVLNHICRFIIDGFFIVCNALAKILENAWSILAGTWNNFRSYLYLLLFAPRDKIKYEYKVPESSKEVCERQQRSIERIENDMEGFKIFSKDLSAIKKKIDDLELEFRREKESRKSQNEFYDKKLNENHQTLQKYQATINHALLSSKRPSHFTNSSIQYFLDNQSDALKQWIIQNFLLKSDSPNIDENKIGLLMAKYSNRTGVELMQLKQEFKQFAQDHKDELKSLKNNMVAFDMSNNLGGGDISETYIRKLITDALKLYDADKTGRVDYALESAGGQILSIRCTETYIDRPKSYVFLGFPIYTKTSSPRDAISPEMNVGQCWAFVGSQGYLVIQLSHTIRVTGFTMEHISKSLVPSGHFESAPNNFSMWGLKSEHDPKPHLFGHYAYSDNEEPRQYFPVTNYSPERYNIVELKISSNHGNPNFTCLYRIRVHGDVRPLHV